MNCCFISRQVSSVNTRAAWRSYPNSRTWRGGTISRSTKCACWAATSAYLQAWKRPDMFTGIIETVGRVRASRDAPGGVRITVDAGTLPLADVKLGDSIAVDGVCL